MSKPHVCSAYEQCLWYIWTHELSAFYAHPWEEVKGNKQEKTTGLFLHLPLHLQLVIPSSVLPLCIFHGLGCLLIYGSVCLLSLSVSFDLSDLPSTQHSVLYITGSRRYLWPTLQNVSRQDRQMSFQNLSQNIQIFKNVRYYMVYVSLKQCMLVAIFCC